MRECVSSIRTALLKPAGLFVVVLWLCCSAAIPAFAFLLPDSDQRKCYQNVSPYAEISCAGTGQDGGI